MKTQVLVHSAYLAYSGQEHIKIYSLRVIQCPKVHPTMAADHLGVLHLGHLVFDFHRVMLTCPGIKYGPSLKKT